jgi:hypothetical protein
MNVVLDKKKDNLYQVACLRVFEMSHKGGVADNVGNHPNSFFNSSLEYKKQTEKKNKTPKPSTAAAPEPGTPGKEDSQIKS